MKEFPWGHFMTIYRQQNKNELLHALIVKLRLNVLFKTTLVLPWVDKNKNSNILNLILMLNTKYMLLMWKSTLHWRTFIKKMYIPSWVLELRTLDKIIISSLIHSRIPSQSTLITLWWCWCPDTRSRPMVRSRVNPATTCHGYPSSGRRETLIE